MGREERDDRRSAARRRAEEHKSGFSTTSFKLPDGVSFWKRDPGVKTNSIIPYIVKKGRDTRGGNPFADAGEEFYERTYYSYRFVGPEEKDYVCPSKTFGTRDFIQEYRSKLQREGKDLELVEKWAPKERQIFFIFDHDAKGEGLQFFDFSHHMFGKLLDTRIRTGPEKLGWDWFYKTNEKGFALMVTFEKDAKYGMQAKAIDFVKRDEPLPASIINHGFDLDDCLVEVPYEKMKAIVLGTDEDPGDEREPEREREPESRSSDNGKQDTKTEDRKPEREEKKPPKEKTAEDLGLAVGDKVHYAGSVQSIFRITGDGYTVTLMDEDDTPTKNVKVSELQEVTPFDKSDDAKKSKESESKPKSEEKKPEREKASSGAKSGEKWDKDWED